MIPDYLSDLKLQEVFKPFCNDVGTFIQESDADQHIVDSSSLKISGFVTPSFGQTEELSQKYFAVENRRGNKFALLQIDNGIIKSRALKKCDCAIANDEELCLVEFKANASSNIVLTIQKNYEKAIAQLKNTLDIFNGYYSSQDESLTAKRRVEAHVCFKQGYPRHTSTQMNYQVKFAQDTGIPLLFDRKKLLI